MPTTAKPVPPGHWDPMAAPYVTRDCRAGRHEDCQGGILYFPDGINGDCVDIACACQISGCHPEVKS